MIRTRIQITLCTAAILVLSGSAFANESVYKQILPATAWIITPTGEASGVLVDMDRKLVATNFHVVKLQREVKVIFQAPNDQKVPSTRQDYLARLDKLSVKGKVIVLDPRRNLALIELERVPEGATALELAPKSPEPGQTVHSIGNPGASDALWVYSTGSVRQVYSRRTSVGNNIIEARMVETQSPVNPGDSGGPVVNDAGQLVGLNSFGLPNSSLFNSSIEVSELKALLKGEIKSIDRGVENTLHALGIKYTINRLGDYAVEVPATNGARHVVVVRSLTWPRGPIREREVYLALPTNGLKADMTMRFLKQNDDLVFGSWSCCNVDGKDFVVYRTTVPAYGEPELLREAIFEVIKNTTSARRELAAIEAQQKLVTQAR